MIYQYFRRLVLRDQEKEKGQVFTKPVDKYPKEEILPIIFRRFFQGVDIYTDNWRSDNVLAVYGFGYKKVKHKKSEFGNGNGNYLNEVEFFWSFFKRKD